MSKAPQLQAKQSRNWCFTLNNYTDEDLKTIDKWHQNNTTAYIIYGKEKGGDTGTAHLQGFIHLPKARAATALKKILPRAHLTICRGSPAENIIYCTKEDKEPTVYGVQPVSQQQANKDKARRFCDLAEAGEFKLIKEEMPGLYLSRYRTMKEMEVDHMVKPDDLKETCGIWIYGETGCGKTHAARHEYGTYFSKPCNKWWDGYQGEDCVVIEDMDPNHSKLAYHLKLWTDMWSFTAEVKGGTRSLRPKCVIITSQYTIAEVFQQEGDEAVAALERRCKVIHMHKDLVVPILSHPQKPCRDADMQF